MAGAVEAARRRSAGLPVDVWRILGWAATALLLFVGCRRALPDPSAAPLPTRANAALTGGQDFRDATYFPAKELLAGGNPYDPGPMFAHWPVNQEFDLYAPLHLVLHLAYAALPYRTALLLFSWVGLAWLVAVGLVSARAMRLPGGWLAAWLVAAAVVLSQIGKSAISIGQINTLVGLGAVLALIQVGRVRVTGPGWSSRLPMFWGSVGLALAWTKPQFGIPLAVLILARGAWRQALLGTGLAFVVSLPVVVILVSRAGGVGGFLDVVRRNLAYTTRTGYAAVDSATGSRVDLAAVFFRLTGWLPPGAELAVLVGVLGLAGWLVAGGGRRGRPFDVPELLVVSLACLVCIAHQPSESLVTVPAIVGLVAMAVRGPAPSAWLVLATALAAVPALRVSAVQLFTAQYLGGHADRLVEGLCLAAAFAVACGLVAARRLSAHS